MEDSNYQQGAGEFQFDVSGGFSVEEQQEILDKINSLSVEKSLVPKADIETKAKKRSFLFPLTVNIAAVIFLALGFSFLSFFHSRTDLDIREGSAVLDLTERKLIQEIRLEMNRRLGEKEHEISDILFRLEEAGAEYRELELSAASLSDEQKERAGYLLRVQEDYRNTLLNLHNERARILEDSRQREQALRVQAEERARELSSRIEQGEASLAAVTEELERLSGEQERAASAEALLGGYYAVLDNQINAASYNDAILTLSSMKAFLNSRVFFGNRSLEAGKQNHLFAVAALEKSINEIRVDGGLIVPPPQAGNEDALREQSELIAALEQKVQEQDKAISALSSRGSDSGRIIAEHEKNIADLRAANTRQQQTIAERDSAIQGLRAESAAKDQRVAQSQAQAATLESRNEELIRNNETLQTQIEAVRMLLQNQ
ncbi:MAG: hypothetical protein LBH43_08720 [Treponema sp.]|jgi:hypothetical protein|nr:hypothetical protein [Treponema sp.]